MSNQEKHLEFIQGVINRLGKNSFLIKGWSVTIVAALFALAAKDINPCFILVAFLPSFFFWLLDSYYLYQERLFRDLYDDARKSDVEKNYSMDISEFDKSYNWFSAAFSKTILIFHGSILLTVTIVYYLFK